MDTILSILFNPVVEVILAGVMAIAVKKWVNYKALYHELWDVGKKYRAVRNPKSAGGKSITSEEYAALGKEVVDVLQEAAKVIPRKWNK